MFDKTKMSEEELKTVKLWMNACEIGLSIGLSPAESLIFMGACIMIDQENHSFQEVLSLIENRIKPLVFQYRNEHYIYHSLSGGQR